MPEKENTEKLKTLCGLEDLAEKKSAIYSRLLMDAELAKDMEALSKRHAQRKKQIKSLYMQKAGGQVRGE
ncbi:MAG: hypothetical protein E7380_06810 [Clostridiales bacterium]|nr:hypothetical protein [Clostridiales bacterium]MBQ2769070.1 hypothetical protein [Clostridia bacterium]